MHKNNTMRIKTVYNVVVIKRCIKIISWHKQVLSLSTSLYFLPLTLLVWPQDDEVVQRCVYWDDVTMQWSGRGCCLNDKLSPPTCECDHLTSFSLIVVSAEIVQIGPCGYLLCRCFFSVYDRGPGRWRPHRDQRRRMRDVDCWIIPHFRHHRIKQVSLVVGSFLAQNSSDSSSADKKCLVNYMVSNVQFT